MTLKEQRYCQMLEVTPDASFDEIKHAYHDLVWVWHPDRFPNNPRLQQKAHNKLQAINEAYDYLKSRPSLENKSQSNPKTARSPQTSHNYARQSRQQTTGHQQHHHKRKSRDFRPPPRSKRFRRRFTPYYIIYQLVLVVGILAIGIYIYSGALLQSPFIENSGKAPHDNQDTAFTLFTGDSEWKHEDHWFNDTFFASLPTRLPEQPEQNQKDKSSLSNQFQPTNLAQESEARPKPMQEKEALAEPMQDNKIPFQPAQKGDAPSKLMQVGEAPAEAVEKPRPQTPSGQIANSNFTLGSTSHEVLAAQGQPQNIRKNRRLDHEIWRYGKSSIRLKGPRKTVVAWNNAGGNLNVTLDADGGEAASQAFGVGSHQDAVLQLQGLPDKVSAYPDAGYKVWRYGYSSIIISTQTLKVLNWNNADNNLKVKRAVHSNGYPHQRGRR